MAKPVSVSRATPQANVHAASHLPSTIRPAGTGLPSSGSREPRSRSPAVESIAIVIPPSSGESSANIGIRKSRNAPFCRGVAVLHALDLHRLPEIRAHAARDHAQHPGLLVERAQQPLGLARGRAPHRCANRRTRSPARAVARKPVLLEILGHHDHRVQAARRACAPRSRRARSRSPTSLRCRKFTSAGARSWPSDAHLEVAAFSSRPEMKCATSTSVSGTGEDRGHEHHQRGAPVAQRRRAPPSGTR